MGSYTSRKSKDSVRGWDAQITLIDIQGESAKPQGEMIECTYHDAAMKEQNDKTIRNCLKGKCLEQRFIKATQPILEKFFSYYQHKIAPRDEKWEILQYEKGGFFRQHRDRRQGAGKQSGLVHVAMEILIPPKSFCSYSGGILTIYHDQDSFSHPMVRADEKKWTHILLPIGISHQVNPVYENTRISYTKNVLVEKREDLDYSVPSIQKLPQQLYN